MRQKWPTGIFRRYSNADALQSAFAFLSREIEDVVVAHAQDFRGPSLARRCPYGQLWQCIVQRISCL